MPAHPEPFELLRTKLYRPRVARDLVRRPRVRAILDRYVETALTLVCAPAGFGKTTLLGDWLSACACPNAWLSLDKRDSDLAVFLAYFIAAIRTVFPDACEQTSLLLRAPQLPPLDVLSTTLANELDRLGDETSLAGGGRLVLVLDDYHEIGGQATHGLLTNLLRHPPRSLHLVISTRHDPPFPLHVLRARGEMGELRASDLRFTRDEVSAFMALSSGMAPDPEVIETLAEQTEGWATGLRLAVVTLGAGGEVVNPVGPAVDNRYVTEYLMNEVLARIPAQTQEFLVRTSILDRLCGPLCDAIAPSADPAWDGSKYLEWLAAQNIFTFSLDPQGHWYRYHHLFRTLLRNWLEREHGPAAVVALHQRACLWCRENGLIEEALHHALAAGDEVAAVQLVQVERHKAMNREDMRQLEHWLSLFPKETIDKHPELQLMEAWILQKQWKFEDIPAHLDRTDALLERSELPQIDRLCLLSEVRALRALIAYYRLDAEATRINAEQAVAAVPLEYSFVRSIAWLYLGAARHLSGDYQGALDALRTGLREDRLHGNTFSTRLYFGFCVIYWMRADLPNLLRTANQFLKIGMERKLPEAICWGHYFRGCAFYMTNDLDRAEEEFEAVVRQKYLAHGSAAVHSAFGMASVLIARGDFAGAATVTETIVAFGFDAANTRIIDDAEVFRVYLSYRQGDIAQAHVWAASQAPARFVAPLTMFHIALLKLAAILVTAPVARKQARQVFALLRQLSEPTNNARVLIETLALEAVLDDAEGDREAALEKLTQALTLAEPSHLIRAFVDLGPAVGNLLYQLVARGVALDYLSELLAAFVEQPGPQPASRQAALIEPLSQRELQVLALLADRLSNKEIAQALNISPMTVKRHTVNIYQKLLVATRRDAVAEAVKLGLVPEHSPATRSRML